MDYSIAVDEGHGLAHLADEDAADSFGEDELIVHHAIKELTSFDAVKVRKMVRVKLDRGKM